MCKVMRAHFKDLQKKSTKNKLLIQLGDNIICGKIQKNSVVNMQLYVSGKNNRN